MSWEMLSTCPALYEFLNADEIARGLAPVHPESMSLTASKLLIKRLKELLENNRSFAFETTASGINYVKHLHLAKQKHYAIHLTFLWLASPKEAIKRVTQRVQQGGHHIPEETIIRRYHTGLTNLIKYYLPLADTALIIDNSSEESKKRVVAQKEKNHLEIHDAVIWKKIEGVAHE